MATIGEYRGPVRARDLTWTGSFRASELAQSAELIAITCFCVLSSSEGSQSTVDRDACRGRHEDIAPNVYAGNGRRATIQCVPRTRPLPFVAGSHDRTHAPTAALRRARRRANA